MNRRDTIIIALLVNAGLLALLFLLAVNTDEDKIVDNPEMAKTLVGTSFQTQSSRPQAPIILADTSINDEVDNFLKDLATEESVQRVLIDEEEGIPFTPDRSSVKQIKKEVISSAKQNYVEVTVKRGDVLEKIAKNNGTTVEAIKNANNLTSAKLSIGQVLLIPIVEDHSTAKSTQTAPAQGPKEIEKKAPTSSEVQHYIMKSGDNPWNIAKQFNVKFDDLLKLNNLDEEKARNLKIGDKIRVK